MQHQNPEIAFAIHQALLPAQENRFHGIPQAVKIDHGHDELGILRPQRDPESADGLVIPGKLQAVTDGGIVLVAQGRPEIHHPGGGGLRQLEARDGFEMAADLRKEVTHALFRGDKTGVFGQDLVDHIAAVGAALVGQLIDLMHHILREDEGIDILFHAAGSPPFSACKLIVNRNVKIVKRFI